MTETPQTTRCQNCGLEQAPHRLSNGAQNTFAYIRYGCTKFVPAPSEQRAWAEYDARCADDARNRAAELSAPARAGERVELKAVDGTVVATVTLAKRPVRGARFVMDGVEDWLMSLAYVIERASGILGACISDENIADILALAPATAEPTAVVREALVMVLEYSRGPEKKHLAHALGITRLEDSTSAKIADALLSRGSGPVGQASEASAEAKRVEITDAMVERVRTWVGYCETCDGDGIDAQPLNCPDCIRSLLTAAHASPESGV